MNPSLRAKLEARIAAGIRLDVPTAEIAAACVAEIEAAGGTLRESIERLKRYRTEGYLHASEAGDIVDSRMVKHRYGPWLSRDEVLALLAVERGTAARGLHEGTLYCYGGCGTRYSDFLRDVHLPTPLWNRIAVGAPFDETQTDIDREGRGGVLCPRCIVARLSALPDCTVITMGIDDWVERGTAPEKDIERALSDAGITFNNNMTLRWVFRPDQVEVSSSGGNARNRLAGLLNQVRYLIDDLLRQRDERKVAPLPPAEAVTGPTKHVHKFEYTMDHLYQCSCGEYK